MSLRNPTINPPRLSLRPHRHSRSPSRSPVRQALDADPLLKDLSPTRTLQAFVEFPASSSTSSKHDSARSTGVEAASPSERALGSRAAQVCIDLRSWCRELHNWEWPGTFEVPEPARKRLRMSVGNQAATHATENGWDEDDVEHWGSLPARTVEAYDRRVDVICRELDDTDVEELKEYVLSVHQQAGGSVDDSLGSIVPAADLRRLDDFTALVTATILQALPYLTRLHQLLDTWTIRLYVLRQAPGYLQDLNQAQADMDDSWTAIGLDAPSQDATDFDRDTMHGIQERIQRQITSLGWRLDTFLDELEGREDTVPEDWIGEFEALESAYGDWVVQAERKVMENGWTAAQAEDHKAAERAKTEQALTAGPPLSHIRTTSDSFARENPDNDGDALVAPSSRPTSGVFFLPYEDHHTSEAYIDPSNAEQENAGQSADTSSQSAFMQTLQRRSTSPTKYSRHIPIILDYDQDGPTHNAQISQTASANDLTALPQPPQVVEPTEPEPGQELTESTHNVKKRAAFLNADLERKATLQRQAKSPVRPFEHASNAFTRLFKREKTPEVARSNSRKSSGSKRNSRINKENEVASGITWSGHQNTGTPQEKSHPELPARSKSASRRSVGADSGRAIYLESSGLQQHVPGRGVSVKDYGDLPGGFRPRSRSEDSRRGRRSIVSDDSYVGGEKRLSRLSRAAVETYQPKRLDAVMRPQTAKKQQEPEYPADWPLSLSPPTEPPSPVKEGQSAFRLGEVTSTTTARDGDTIKPEDAPVDDMQEDSSPETKSPQPLATDDFHRLFVGAFPAVQDSEAPRSSISFSRPRSNSPRKSQTGEPMVDDTMLDPYQLGPVEHDLQVKPDDRIIYDGLDQAGAGAAAEEPTAGISGAAVSNEASEVVNDAEPRDEPDREAQQPRSRPRPSVNPILLELKIPPSPSGGLEPDVDDELFEARPNLISRASIASIESFPRSELKSVEVLRRRSDATISLSRPQTPMDSAPVSALPADSPSQMSLGYKGMVVFPTPPRGRQSSLPRSPVSPIADELERIQLPTSRFATLPFGTLVEETPSGSPTSDKSISDASPAPLSMAVSKRQDNAEATDNFTLSPTKKRTTAPDQGGDTFDRHVSEVLERLPSTSIRFRSRPGAETPSHQRTAEPRGARPRTARRASSNHHLTLAPAEATPKKSTSTTENEVKLYHLTQAGREDPIKLFVRLVGEGERVMVRVGGGWADLAEYLRQYAEHHGSRTTVGLEPQAAETLGASSGGRKVSSSSTSADPNGKAATSRPGSRWEAPEGAQTPNSSSRPSTADSARAEQKSRWVEGMIEQAKMSAEKSRSGGEKGRGNNAGEKVFGDLGRAGATRRLVFRRSSATTHQGEGR